MIVERLNPETPHTNANPAQPDKEQSFNGVHAAKPGAEKKGHRRKKNHRKHRVETSEQTNQPVDETQVKKHHELEAPKPLEDGAVMLWQRPEMHESKPAEFLPAPEPESVPVPPPMPPDPTSYRRRFWQEQSTLSSDEQAIDREALPVVYEYGQPQLEAEPMHHYVPHQSPETSRKTVQSTSVETHTPAPAFEASQETTSHDQPERQLNRQELLRLAKSVTIDGVRLKDIYATNRIDEAGLRAVVDVYLHGGDVKQQLTREIVAKEQSYERDPQLRHQRPVEYGRKPRSGTSQKIAQVLGKAKVIAGEQGAKLAVSSQKTAKSASKVLSGSAKQAQRDLIDNSNTMDWISITAVVVLWSIILLLWLG